MDTRLEQISQMSSEEAGQELARMTAARAAPPPVTGPDGNPIPPATASDARARLDALVADKNWGARYPAGNVAERHQLADLLKAMEAGESAAVLDPTPPTQIMNFTQGGELPKSHVASFIEDSRRAGLNDDVIAEAVTGRPVWRSERALVERYQRMKHGDADWVKRLLSGDYEAGREHRLMSQVMAAPLRDP